MKKIVVPVDFSGDSVKAFQKAIYLARRTSSEISLIHVIRTRTFVPFMGSKNGETYEEVEKSFKELLSKTNLHFVKVDYHIKKGKVSREIVRFAEDMSAYMIVMGTHGASGFEEFWMGSNAYKVVNHSPCPVLTLRGNVTKEEIRKIVLPIDTTSATRQKVPFTAEFAKSCGAEIHVLSVCIDETEEFITKLTNYSAQVVRFLSKQGVRSTSEFMTGDNPTDMAIEYAKKVDADLISIMTDQEDSIMNLFLGPYAQQMVNHSPIPVITMHKNPALEGDVHIM